MGKITGIGIGIPFIQKIGAVIAHMFSYWITDTGDNIVTDTGDKLVFKTEA
jgi:hypothetical protein